MRVGAVRSTHQTPSKGSWNFSDDFGTGHSSMQQISRIPFTELKIDRSLVIAADRDAAVMAILESRISLAKSLNLHSVAEGVETEQQWDLVAS